MMTMTCWLLLIQCDAQDYEEYGTDYLHASERLARQAEIGPTGHNEYP